jgi:dTDP-4-amino-4,6-dideoxygalactose transaminase
VVTDDDDVAERVRSLRNHGVVTSAGRADYVNAGLNYRLTDFQAALVEPQLARLESDIEHRREIAAGYDAALAHEQLITLPSRFERRGMVYQTYHVLLDPSISRDDLIPKLRASEVEVNLGAHALAAQTYYRKKYALRPEDYPNAQAAYRQGLALPMGTHVRAADVAFVAERLLRAIS